MSRSQIVEKPLLHALVEAQIERTPDAVAVVFGPSELTYRELDRRANRIARRLQALGVGPETRVGVSLERSLELLPAILGVLKAGGAFVPLDPNYPRERLEFMIRDAGIELVLTRAPLRSRLPAALKTALCLDGEWAQIAQGPAEPPVSGVQPENAAYVIYTSGSTGQPKGVLIPHGAIARHTVLMQECYRITPDDRVLQFNTLNFDTAVEEIFSTLAVGAALVLLDSPQVWNPLEFYDKSIEYGLTVAHLSPGYWHQLVLVESHRRERRPGDRLRLVTVGGDVMWGASAALWMQSPLREVRLLNVYGPTEAVVSATFLEVTPETITGNGVISIGHPIPGYAAYILDAEGRPVPPGTSGELCLGSECLARGYLNHPELTAERFVPDPFSAGPHARLYRTGDWVYTNARGELEFVGRIDRQVKIRGFRIELGEIEARLLEHPRVGAAVVLAREDVPGEKRLVAYVVDRRPEAGSAGPLTDRALRAFLREHLPESMLPAAFVFLEALPLTAIGKIDRRALPAPPPTRPELETPWVAPRTPLEEALAAIWEAALRLEGIGVDDNFFELGGQSLLGMQIVGRINEQLRSALTLEALFSNPTVAGLAAVLEAGGPASETAGLPAADRTQPLPLSYSQQALWFMDQYLKELPVYNIPLLFRISGRLEVGALQQALTEILRRHEALRTVFLRREDGAEPEQRVLPARPWPLTVEDRRGEPAEAWAARLDRAARRIFDLSRDLLVDGLLLQVGDSEYCLLLTFHHIVFDGWSNGVLIAELEALYRAFVEGAPSPLPALSRQYADFSVWQQRVLTAETLLPDVEYWKHRLIGAPPLLALPTDRSRPAVQRYQGALVKHPLPATRLAALEAVGQRANASLFMTLLAAFEALLARYTRQEDLVVGIPFAGRDRVELEPLIGYFINTLPLRVDLSGNPPFLTLLERVRAAATAAFTHHRCPLAQIVEALDLPRNTSYQPLFQVIFVMEDAPERPIALPELRMEFQEELNTGTTKADLTLRWEFPAQGPVVSIEYDTDLFDRETVERLLARYVHLLEAVAADPRQPIALLPLLEAAELRQLLEEWSLTRTAYPRELTVSQLFEAQAARTPDAVALVRPATADSPERMLTYGALNAQANRLAHLLRGLGVGPEVLVGLCAERSVEMIVGLLGILKAGGSYVPLDPHYPRERLAFMLEDTQAAVLVTQAHLEGHLPPHGLPVVRLDLEGEAMARASAENLPGRVKAEHLAYVMYTSGSTGHPKGIGIPHRGIVRLVRETNYLTFGPEEVFLQLSTVSFDAATLEIWGSLLNGAKLVLYPGARPSFEELGRTLVAQGITTLWLTTGLFNPMVEAQPESLSAVRRVLTGGEVASAPHVQRMLDRLGPGSRIINGYGPTENTTFTCCYPMAAGESVGSSVPIGRPIANTRVYVLDRYLQPVPIGVPGELCTGGDGLGRGYHRQPGLTAERFVPDPFSGEPGARLYRTGDLVRWRSDGTIEFLGRVDHQVKIRGFRIELEELETVLYRHPAVKEVVVVVAERAGDKQLVAYVVDRRPEADDGAAAPRITGPELRAYLQERVPEYMIPAAFVILDAFPLNPVGKLDRAALPAPDWGRRGERGREMPRNPIEAQLAGIWTEVLKTSVGIDDNFFELGGHSLLAAQVISRIRQAFRVEIPLRALFEAPTVAGLAERIAQAEDAGTVRAIRAAAGRRTSAPLSFSQQRLWFLDQLEPGSAAYNIPFWARLQGALDFETLRRSLELLVNRHDTLRTTFVMEAGAPQQRIAPAQALKLPVVDLRMLPAEQQAAQAQRFADQELRRPFDLARGPLWRATLLRLGEAEHILFLTLHHSIADGWSLSVLVRELTTAYAEFRAGREPSLPELPIQYADFAVWQREWLQDAVLAEPLAYWKRQLGGSLPVLDLPTDRPWSALRTLEGAMQTLTLPAALVGALKGLSQQADATLFMTLLAAFNVLLARYSGQDDIIVGSPIAGRTQQELEGLIGLFLNTLALRTDLSGAPTFRALLGRVRAMVLEAYAHQDLPFEKLVEELHPPRDLQRSPLFDVLLNFVNTPPVDWALPGLRFSQEPFTENEAKYALTLYIYEAGETLELQLVYRRELFSAERIAVLLEQYQGVLEQIAAHPEQAIPTYSLVTESTRGALPDPRRPLPVPDYPLVTEAVLARAAQWPDRPALRHQGRVWCYDELVARACTIGRALVARGLRPGETVAVAGARSRGLIAGMLGVFFGGGVLLTLDPALPARRRELLLREGRVRFLLLLEPAALQDLPHTGFEALEVIPVDPVTGAPHNAPDPTVGLPALKGDDPAYLFFTSGTTGVPKGVLGRHRGLAHFLAWQRETFEIGGGDRCAQLTALSFDVVLRDIFTPLTSGATLCLPEEDVYDPQRILPWLAQEGISVIHTVPAVMEAWLNDAPPGLALPALRRIFSAGEPLPDSLVRRWRQAFAGAGEIINLYGPTETTLAKCFYRVPAEPLPGIQSVGEPLPETQALVLQGDRLCGVGETGEIVIRTPFRSLGYLNLPEETRQRFVRNPFREDDPGDLLYRTGDCGRYRPDGLLEILGRLDFQVKIRGVRVELGEIESLLLKHPAVRSAVVVAREAQGEKRLIAYWVDGLSDGVQAAALRDYLRERLPEFMVPAAFVRLEALPLTATGKIDRRALPEPVPEAEAPAAGPVGPQTPYEEVVVEIWSEVLHRPVTGIHDDFFDLGGHSLLATQVVSRVRDRFEIDLPVRSLFETRTVARMAQRIEAVLLAEIDALSDDEVDFLLDEDSITG